MQGWLKGINSTAISAATSGECSSGSAYDILNVSGRQQLGQPAQYVAKTKITFFDGFESGTNDSFEAYTDPAATACIPVSSVSPYSAGDMGQDGSAMGNINMARDAFGFSLNYHNGDYSPITAPVAPFSPGLYNLPGAPSDGLGSGAELFNGNIASMMVSIPKLMTNTGGDGSGQMLYGYQYDQLNRLVRMNAYRGSDNQANTFSPVAIDDYKERISYDPNGNILSYTRNGTTSHKTFFGYGCPFL